VGPTAAILQAELEGKHKVIERRKPIKAGGSFSP
jgi:hypothetical protein